MRWGIISLFPEMFAALNYGVVGRAIQQNTLTLQHYNPRDYVKKPEGSGYRVVDDRPYGGGPGMVMMAQPLSDALKVAKADLGKEATVIHLSPQGKTLDQEAVKAFAKRASLVLIASRYEGVDERFLESEVDEEWSIGDYVISGGEFAAMVMIDAVTRLLPGVLGDADSAEQDSFMNGLLDCPHYTRPEVFESRKVPDVLLSGNHAAISQWRLKQALGRTWHRRPDLLAKRVLTPTEEQLLNDFIREYQVSRGTTHE